MSASVRLAPAPHAAAQTPATSSSSVAPRGPLGVHPGAGAGAFASVLQGTLAGPRTSAPASAPVAAATSGPSAQPTSASPTAAAAELTAELTAELGESPADPAPVTAPEQPSALLPPRGFSLPVLPSAADTGGTDAGSAGTDVDSAEMSTADSAETARATATVSASESDSDTSTAAPAAPGTALPAGGLATLMPAPATTAAGALPSAGTASAGIPAATRTSVTGDPVATVNPNPAEASTPTALLVPLGTPAAAAPATAPVVPAGVPAPAAPPTPLAGQIARPLFSLVGAANGDHVMTISVSPDNLGPVTVQAHVRGEHLRVELFAPTDLARDALRAILPDLRRDLSGGGLNAQLTLSADARASDPSASRQGGPDARSERQAGDGSPGRGDPPAEPTVGHTADLRLSSLRAAGSHSIDVLA